MTTFKIVFTFDVFLSAETTMHCKVTCILYQGLKLAVAHTPFASKFQCGPLKISSQSSTWRVKIRKNKIV